MKMKRMEKNELYGVQEMKTGGKECLRDSTRQVVLAPYDKP